MEIRKTRLCRQHLDVLSYFRCRFCFDYESFIFVACPAGWDTVGGVCYKTPAATATIATPDDGLAACAKLDPKAKLPEFYNLADFDSFIRMVG